MGLLERVRDGLVGDPGDRAAALMAEARAHADAGRFDEALAIWEPLARAGVARAANNIGACFANGSGVEADAAMAVRWIEPAADERRPGGAAQPRHAAAPRAWADRRT